jgi:fumarate hydratase class II
LHDALLAKEEEFAGIVKLGRTHLQDATPLRLSDEVSAWRKAVGVGLLRVDDAAERLRFLGLGGTAVGTGINAPAGFDEAVVKELSAVAGTKFVADDNKFYQISAKDTVAAYSSALKDLAISLNKIANDLRLLSCGPRGGIGELILPANEPGSSIMPGKVNPTQVEAMTMVAARVIGNDTTVSFAAASGQLQLNTYMPVIIKAVLESGRLLADAAQSFSRNLVQGLAVNEARTADNLSNSLMVVTALAPKIGYEAAAILAKKAHADGKSIREVALETTKLTAAELDELLNPASMA